MKEPIGVWADACPTLEWTIPIPILALRHDVLLHVTHPDSQSALVGARYKSSFALPVVHRKLIKGKPRSTLILAVAHSAATQKLLMMLSLVVSEVLATVQAARDRAPFTPISNSIMRLTTASDLKMYSRFCGVLFQFVQRYELRASLRQIWALHEPLGTRRFFVMLSMLEYQCIRHTHCTYQQQRSLRQVSATIWALDWSLSAVKLHMPAQR